MGAVDAAPFGVEELLAAAAGAARVLDAGCGSGKLTVALARAGADVTGVDTSLERLEQARGRAARAGVPLRLLEADLDRPAPFPDASFDAVVSRLVLMAVADPVATLRELARTLAADGVLATALWAELPLNPWFALPREAVAAALGAERAAFARVFGQLGSPAEAAAAHCEAGLREVEPRLLRERVERADAAAHWSWLAREIGHFRRLDAGLQPAERERVLAELEPRLAPFLVSGRLLLPRTLVLVTARR